MYGMPAPSRDGKKDSAYRLYDPTTATAFSLAPAGRTSTAATLSLWSLQVSTLSLWPLMPPLALIQRA